MDDLADLAARILRRLDDSEKTGESALSLLDAYRSGSPEHDRLWREQPELYLGFVKRLIREGHPARAFELARERREYLRQNPPPDPPDPLVPEGYELRYRHALAANRGGNPRHAERLLRPVLDAARRADAPPGAGLTTGLRVDAIALQGSILKSLSRREPGLVEDAIALYAEATRVPGADELPDGGTFPRVNQATLLRVANRGAESRRLAEDVLRRAEARYEGAPEPARYWLAATIGEACVLTGDHGRAVAWYQTAITGALAAGALGSIEASLVNLHRLADAGATMDAAWIEQQIGSLVVFSGHMIDSPDRYAARHPARFPNFAPLVNRVAAAIRDRLRELNARVGFSSLACGADILFAEAMIQRDAELHVVLPFAEKDFVRTSVHFGLTDDREMVRWRQRFEGVLGRVPDDRVHFATTEPYLQTGELFGFVNTFTQGLAYLRAQQRVTRPKALVLHDPGAPAGGEYGTEHFRQTWRRARLPEAEAIRLDELRGVVPPPLAPAAPKPPPEPLGPGLRRTVKALLFTDVAGFSRVPEDLLPPFLTQYTGFLRRAVASAPDGRVVFANTWGDGLYVVFDRVADAAEFALALLEAADPGAEGAVDWAKFGLGTTAPLRVALHAGPVFELVDLFQERPGYHGQHVNRAARIEPVTVPGCAYASEQFAAHLVMEAPDRFGCEFVGVLTLPKGYDRCPLYHVTRR